MTMLNELTIVDMVERAHSDRPYCNCGRDTTTTYRDGVLWLDCAVVTEPVTGKVQRLWNAVSAPGHVHELIVDIPRPDFQAA